MLSLSAEPSWQRWGRFLGRQNLSQGWSRCCCPSSMSTLHRLACTRSLCVPGRFCPPQPSSSSCTGGVLSLCTTSLTQMRRVSAKNAFSEAGRGVRRCCWDCAGSSSWRREGRAARNTPPQPAPRVCRNGSCVLHFSPLPAPCRIWEAQEGI